MKKEKRARTKAILLSIAFLVFMTIASVKLIGLKPLWITSGSMEPTIMTNSMNIVVDVRNREINIGDIIFFEKLNGVNITHRVVGIEENNKTGEISYITKGDSNNQIDSEMIQKWQIRGIVIATQKQDRFISIARDDVIGHTIISAILIIVMWALIGIAFMEKIKEDGR